MNIPRLTKKKSLIFSGVLLSVIILLIIITGILSQSQRTGKEQAQNAKEAPPPEYPKVQVESWIGGQAPTIPSTLRVYDLKQVTAREEAESLSQKIMGTNQLRKTPKDLYISTISTEKDLSAFVYNAIKGEYSYASTNGIVLPGEETSSTETKINNFLNILFFDPTLKITANYQRKDKPGVTYYEIHRDWNAMGLPIINSFGVLNIKEDQKLSSLALGPSAETSAADPAIHSSSDNTDGQARLTDFNTMTIGVRNGNTVDSLLSNIRQINTTQLKLVTPIAYDDAVSQLRNSEYEFFYTSPSGEGMPTFDKVYPDNKGLAKEAIITETMLAYIEQNPAVAQDRLKPYYLFRGTAELESGYRVNFIAGVPAVTTQGVALGVSSALAQRFPQSPYDTGMKIGTFGNPVVPTCGLNCPTPTPTPTPGCGIGISCPPPTRTPTPRCGIGLSCPPTPPTRTPTPLATATPTPTPLFPTATVPPPTATPTPTPTPTPTATPTPTEPPANPTITPTPTTPPPFVPTVTPTPTTNCGPFNVFCVTLPPTEPPTDSPTEPPVPTATPTPTSEPPNNNFCVPTVNDLTNKKVVFFNLHVGWFGEWYAYSTGSSLTASDLTSAWSGVPAGAQKRDRDRVIQDLELFGGDCPIRISGSSPTLFVYQAPGETVTINPHSAVNYSEPALLDKTWNVTVTKDSKTRVNGLLRDHLYYEYQPISFTRPQKGWNIEKDGLEAFVSKLASQLKLTQKEEKRLLFELNHAAFNFTSKTLFVGIINDEEIDKKLPLSIEGVENVVRIHFYVEKADSSTSAPFVQPIQRSSSMVLELGAVAQ